LREIYCPILEYIKEKQAITKVEGMFGIKE